MNNQQTLFEIEPAQRPAPKHVPVTQVPLEDGLPIAEWICAHGFESILSELVLRAKTIEANMLHSAGSDAELEYLLRAYDGDEEHLKSDLAQLGAYLRIHKMRPRLGVDTTQTSL